MRLLRAKYSASGWAAAAGIRRCRFVWGDCTAGYAAADRKAEMSGLVDHTLTKRTAACRRLAVKRRMGKRLYMAVHGS